VVAINGEILLRPLLKRRPQKHGGKIKIEEVEQSVLGGGIHTTIQRLIEMYLDDPHVKIGRTKRYSLLMIMNCDIGSVRTDDLKPKHVVDFCKDRKKGLHYSVCRYIRFL
jgi:hypothetical protein